MKVEWRTILGASLFLGIICAIYWFWSYEDAGTAMLLFSFAAYGMLGGYLVLQWYRRHKLPRPEDRYDATQADGYGAVAYFPAASVWPAGLGLGAIMLGVAILFGSWYWLISMPLIFGAAIGWVVESEHALDLAEDVPLEYQWGEVTPGVAHDPNPAARDYVAAEAATQAAGGEIPEQEPLIERKPFPGPGVAPGDD